MFEQPLTLLLITLLISLIPILLAIATSYLKVNIVLLLIRNAIGVQQVPSGLIVMTISLALSSLIMQPIIEDTLLELEQIEINSLQQENLIGIIKQTSSIFKPWKNFLSQHAGEKELAMLVNMMIEHKQAEIKEPKDNTFLLLMAFVLSELKEAFFMGLIIILPFLLVDFIVANLLAGMGMFMFSPVLLALPLKVLLIVALDFWSLIFKALFISYV